MYIKKKKNVLLQKQMQIYEHYGGGERLRLYVD